MNQNTILLLDIYKPEAPYYTQQYVKTPFLPRRAHFLIRQIRQQRNKTYINIGKITRLAEKSEHLIN